MFSNYLEPYFLQVVFEMISYYYQHFCIILDISNILFKHRASCYIPVPSQGSSWSGLQKGPASLTMWIFSALKADSSSLLQEQDLSLLPPSDPLRTWSGQRSPANRVQFFPESKHEVQRTKLFWLEDQQNHRTLQANAGGRWCIHTSPICPVQAY